MNEDFWVISVLGAATVFVIMLVLFVFLIVSSGSTDKIIDSCDTIGGYYFSKDKVIQCKVIKKEGL